MFSFFVSFVPPRSPLFPYTTLFRSYFPTRRAAITRATRTPGANPVDCSPAMKLRQFASRSEEHTSELQSRGHLVCRLLLEKKKINTTNKSQIIYGYRR